eukprot:CAMPEP_0206531154 /NCGR_PEP_ID=MMETSP0325_2-20121206/3602_1 /ASSEMBLY_ACC=CAM_ASM_000347 /TAXON_ID=2866 /ORGANISM="Crypthecodinium cohnii, Strain Seligo" /LENGTH=50 /DNA_ID=CAMNT_0054027355 /DNA_START=96 /DNA_END=248 /DNA_ORIENTATION=-
MIHTCEVVEGMLEILASHHDQGQQELLLDVLWLQHAVAFHGEDDSATAGN